MKDHQVADLLASGTSARPDRTTNASVVWAACAHAGAANPSIRRAKNPATIDRRIPITSTASAVFSDSVVNSTRIGTIGPMERQRTLSFQDPGRLCGVRTGWPTT
jgi:hypothetical protein